MNTESVVQMQRRLCEAQEKVTQLEAQNTRLLAALKDIVYVDSFGCYCIGFRGGTDVTHIVGDIITEAESQS